MNKVVLITGGSSGIGKETVYKFAKNGYDVIFTYNKSKETSKTIEKDIKSSYNVNIYSIKCDISMENDVKSLADFVRASSTKIDVLVNNAGYGYRSAVEEGEIEAVQTLYQTNLFGPIELIKAVLPKVRERKWGDVLNVT